MVFFYGAKIITIQHFSPSTTKNSLLTPYNKKIPAKARIFKNQKPKFMKPFTCSLSATGLYDKNRCKNTIFSTFARVSSRKITSFFPFWTTNPQILSFRYELASKVEHFTKKIHHFVPHLLTKKISLLIFAT